MRRFDPLRIILLAHTLLGVSQAELGGASGGEVPAIDPTGNSVGSTGSQGSLGGLNQQLDSPAPEYKTATTTINVKITLGELTTSPTDVTSEETSTSITSTSTSSSSSSSAASAATSDVPPEPTEPAGETYKQTVLPNKPDVIGSAISLKGSTDEEVGVFLPNWHPRFNQYKNEILSGKGCVMVLFYADLKARQKNGDSCTWNTTPKNEAFWWGTTANGMAPFCDDEQFVLTTEPPVNDNVKTYEMREHSEAAVFVVLGNFEMQPDEDTNKVLSESFANGEWDYADPWKRKYGSVQVYAYDPDSPDDFDKGDYRVMTGHLQDFWNRQRTEVSDQFIDPYLMWYTSGHFARTVKQWWAGDRVV